jgi:hypothetical protein
MYLPYDRAIPPFLAEALRSLPPVSEAWDGKGEYPTFNGRRIPKFIEDRLGIWGRASGLGRVEVWNELQRWIPLLPLEPDLRAWEGVIPDVLRAFRPRVQAQASQTYFRRVSEEYGLVDPYVPEFILATIATVSIPGDPVWGFIVGAPSALKTEFLRWHVNPATVFTLSRLTAHSLISGLKGGSSLLPELNGRTLIVKDFTTVLEMDRHARDEVFGQLRDSFDGYYEGHYGSVGKLSFKSHYHVLAAVTGAIEGYYSIQSSLGQRFLKVRVPPLDAFDRCIQHGGREEELRMEFTGLVEKVLATIQPEDWRSVRFDRVQELRPIVELLALGRTHVSRSEGSISMNPEPEMVPRVTKQLMKLAIGRALIYGRTEVSDSDLEFLRRVAVDTLPINRGLILKALSSPKTADQIAYFIRLPRATVYRHLEDLEALDLIADDGGKPLVYRRMGPAKVLNTPHFSETVGSGRRLTEVGGDPVPRSGKPGSWTEHPVAHEGSDERVRANSIRESP